ncbi:MAG TPA: ABC transporter permease [Woeseiaceae bacterium]|nr:ABC transporter permease [Woeseiaceae bacterium]
MKTLKQILAVTLLNLRNLPKRMGASAVAIVGVAAVVLVFAAVLSMARGFERTMLSAGTENTAIVLRSGATSEMNSGLSNEQVVIVENAPGVLRDGDASVVSPELYVIADVRMRHADTDANVPFRGVLAGALEVRPSVRITEGRMFEPGKREIVAGRAAHEEFMGLDVGSTIRFGQAEWEIVGIFDAGGSVSESEIWTDVRVLQAAYNRGNSFQTIRAKLEGPGSLAELETALEEDPRLDVDVMSERDYYATQSGAMTEFIGMVGYPLTILMAIGAVFGALNAMYSSVSVRGKEIATLRALGFGPFPVMVSTIIESTLLALIGGLIGAAIAYFVFNGFQVSTLNGASFSQVVFNFAVTPDLLAQGLWAALFIGVVGGLFPAIRAARLPVAQALREL